MNWSPTSLFTMAIVALVLVVVLIFAGIRHYRSRRFSARELEIKKEDTFGKSIDAAGSDNLTGSSRSVARAHEPDSFPGNEAGGSDGD